jgi:hypothetical protein
MTLAGKRHHPVENNFISLKEHDPGSESKGALEKTQLTARRTPLWADLNTDRIFPVPLEAEMTCRVESATRSGDELDLLEKNHRVHFAFAEKGPGLQPADVAAPMQMYPLSFMKQNETLKAECPVCHAAAQGHKDPGDYSHLGAATPALPTPKPQVSHQKTEMNRKHKYPRPGEQRENPWRVSKDPRLESEPIRKCNQRDDPPKPSQPFHQSAHLLDRNPFRKINGVDQ